MPSEVTQLFSLSTAEEITIIHLLSVFYMPDTVRTLSMDSCSKNKIQRIEMRKMVF